MHSPLPNLIQRIVAGMFGLVFAGVGLSFGFGIWGHSGFGAPPLLFRLVFSAVGLLFATIGIGIVISAITNQLGPGALKNHLHEFQKFHSELQQKHEQRQPGSNVCPNCSAPVGNAEISPSGDVKCLHCKNWYNVRR